MSVLTWQAVGAVDPAQLGEARHHAHNAAQWLARMAHSYAQPEPGHRHVLLHWDAPRQALVTGEFLPKLTLELRIPNLALQFREDGKTAPHVLEIDDRTPAEVEAWVLVELLHRREDRDRFSKALPYEFPNLMTGDAVPYVTEGREAALAELAAWFANASSVLARLAEENGESAPGASAVRCWPEVFHIGVLLPARADRAAGGPMLRAGLALGSADRPEPYFYVVPHDPRAIAQARPERVLTAAAVQSGTKPAESVLDFLREAIAANRKPATR